FAFDPELVQFSAAQFQLILSSPGRADAAAPQPGLGKLLAMLQVLPVHRLHNSDSPAVDSKMATTGPIRWIQMHPSKQLGARLDATLNARGRYGTPLRLTYLSQE